MLTAFKQYKRHVFKPDASVSVTDDCNSQFLCAKGSYTRYAV